MSQEVKEKRDEATDSTTLSELFDNAFELFNAINKTEESTNSPKVQSDIKQAMKMFEDATRLVSIVDMFSANESFEEVATENIKYFLLPALLGTLTTKVYGTDDRKHIVNVAEVYFLDFLKRVKTYGLTDIEIPEPKPKEEREADTSERTRSGSDLITEMVTKRNVKLQRYKEQKQLEAHLDTLKKSMDNPNIDDEIKRDYFVTLVKLYVNLAVDELHSITAEKAILESYTNIGSSRTQEMRKQKVEMPKLKPIIITRDQVQKKVYGAGYPSLPVMTVEEFYEQRVKDGDWPDAGERNKINNKCLQDAANSDQADGGREDPEEIEKEQKIDADDPELLERLRAMDEYKDTHRRGWGNRANRS